MRKQNLEKNIAGGTAVTNARGGVCRCAFSRFSNLSSWLCLSWSYLSCLLRSGLCFLLTIILIGVSSTSVFAGIDKDLAAFYDSIGYDSNITAAGAYHSQEAGYYAGGSAILRSRVRNLAVVHLDAPLQKSGCGGIDLFFGGFSFINAEQLTKFFRQIMNNATGYAFNLALETMVPEIAHAMQYMQAQAQKINAMNFNSCETAEALVGGLWPKTRANHQQVCQDLGTLNGAFADWAMARQKCGNGGETDKVLDKAAKEKSYAPRILTNKNIIWEAIKQSGFLKDDPDTAMLVMNLTGTIIYNAKGVLNFINPRLNENIVKTLLDGGDAEILVCDEKDLCLAPKEGKLAIKKDNGLRSQIIKTINEIVVGTIKDTKTTDKQKGFINSVAIPIVKFTNVALTSGNDAQALQLTIIADAIAKELLKKYLVELLSLTKSGITTTQDYESQLLARLEANIQAALVFAENIKVDAHQEIQDLTLLLKNMHDTEKEVTAKISDQLKRHLNGGGCS